LADDTSQTIFAAYTMDEDLTEIQVRFVTKLDASVPDTTFSLPVRLQRYGLSGVVNHLLAQGSTLHWHDCTVPRLQLQAKLVQ
jgi:hypothetical protein